MHNHEEPSPEPWITKQRLAEHLSVTTRWIELQQQRGLPHIHTPGMNRYRISEVEAWLREQYGWHKPSRPVRLLCSASPAASRISPLFATIRKPTANRGARIRTGDLADPNGARYQAAPRPDARQVSHKRPLRRSRRFPPSHPAATLAPCQPP